MNLYDGFVCKKKLYSKQQQKEKMEKEANVKCVTKRASNGLHIYDFPSRLFGPHKIKQYLSTLLATMNE